MAMPTTSPTTTARTMAGREMALATLELGMGIIMEIMAMPMRKMSRTATASTTAGQGMALVIVELVTGITMGIVALAPMVN